MDGEKYQKQREQMVKEQLIPRGINNQRVLAAFSRVPRHLFVPPELRSDAYEDYPLPIGLGQTISQPYMVALMTQSLQLQGDERVLEIGTGSGYQTAILAELAREVYTVERLAPLAEEARRKLEELQYTNIHFRIGDGAKGWPEEVPFDAILVAAAAERVPAPLLKQLSPGGRLVIPVGEAPVQDLLLLIKDKQDEKKISEQILCGCRFVPLIEEEED